MGADFEKAHPKFGRCERIRTTDLTVPNQRLGKNVSFCLFESCSHQGFIGFLHFFTSAPIRWQSNAVNSVHNLATGLWGETVFKLAHLQLKDFLFSNTFFSI